MQREESRRVRWSARMLCNLRTRALLIVFACLMCACSADKQTDDLATFIHHVIPPLDPCDQQSRARAPLEVDSIQIGIATNSNDPNTYQMYVNVQLERISEPDSGTLHCCSYTPFTRRPSEIATVYVYPRSYLPDGVYKINAYLFRGEYDAMWCDVSKAEGNITLHDLYYKKGYTGCGPRILVQYDCMNSYDIRYNGALLSRLNSALGESPIYDTVAFRIDQTNLPNQTFQDPAQFRLFVRTNWELAFQNQIDSALLYLGAVEDINRAPGVFPGAEQAAGVSSGFGGENAGLGEPGSYTLIFAKFIRDTFAPKDHKDLFLRCVTYEMGHTRGKLTHASGATIGLHESNFKCVMIGILDINIPGSINIDHSYSRFCADCRLISSVASWP